MHGGGGQGGRGNFDEDEILGKAYDARLMRRLLGYLRPYRGLVIIALLIILGISVTEAAPPVIAKFIVDNAIAPAVNGVIGTDEGLARLAPLGFAYIAVLVVSSGLRYAQTMLASYVGQKAMYDLRVELFAHLQGLSLTFFDRNPVGRLMTRITNDIDALTDMVTQGVVAIFGDIVVIGVIAIVLLVLDFRLALVTFAALPLLIWLTMYFRRIMRDSFRSIRIRLARINAYLNENLSGMAIVQLFTRERASFKQFDDLNTDLLNANRGQIRAMSMFFPAVGFTRAATSAALFVAGGFWILKGEMTIGTLLAFWQLVDRFFQPIGDLAEKYNIMQAAMASSERVFRLLDTKATIVDPPHPRELAHVRGEITFENVSFAYNEGDWVLRDVNFKISAAESVAIVGATGAGKTSIISLISRFYDVQKGRILLDGVDLRDLRQKDVRKHVGVVLQDPFLFSGTVAQNIRLGSAWITDAGVEKAAEQVNVADFIRSLPQGFQEQVRERGSTLSTGQKQLISFARALAHEPKILILDEATSSVDTETEFRVRDALARMVEGRTSLIIAHRLSTIQRAHKIILLHKGQLREMGSHQQLLAQHGIYFKLYQLQYKDQELPSPASAITAD